MILMNHVADDEDDHKNDDNGGDFNDHSSIYTNGGFSK